MNLYSSTPVNMFKCSSSPTQPLLLLLACHSSVTKTIRAQVFRKVPRVDPVAAGIDWKFMYTRVSGRAKLPLEGV